jgi:hypothetical protein
MNLETENPSANGYEKIVDRKVIRVQKHFGGRQTTYFYNDGTECNVYSDFRPGIDSPDATTLSADKAAALEKKYKSNTMSKTSTAVEVNASTKATKAKKVVVKKTPVAKPAKKDAAAPKAPKGPKIDADAAKVIADFATNPLPSEFTEENVHARLGRWNATLYRWVRSECVKTGNRIAGKTAYTLKADLPTA